MHNHHAEHEHAHTDENRAFKIGVVALNVAFVIIEVCCGRVISA